MYQVEYGKGSLGKFVWMQVVSVLKDGSLPCEKRFSQLIRLTNKPLASPSGVDLKENVTFDALYCDFINGKIVGTQLKSDDSAIHVTSTDLKADF